MHLIMRLSVFQPGTHTNVEDREKLRVAMDRVKHLEAENSSLVLENERQRLAYEKCLDDIANQVVHALLMQKVPVCRYFLLNREYLRGTK